jgi:ubiquinone/menaquinone biosynthesis C-methylase UbiE
MTRPNQDQYEAWNGESGRRWVAEAERRDEVLAPIAARLLAVADPRPGEHVLDIGCGCGATTLAAARAATPGGTATGIDLSVPMLDVARRRATTSGVANATFLAADAQTHAFGTRTVDLAISRFGTMFFDDPTAAFTNIASAIRPGGRLRIATWQPLEANDWLTVPGAALLAYGTLPDSAAGGPGMFAQSDPALATRVLRDAGWQDITVEPHTLTLRLGADAEQAARYLADSGVARAVLETIDERARPDAIRAVTETLARHVGPAGVELGAGIHLIHATA